MNEITYKIFYQDNKILPIVLDILNETDYDFVPPLSAKFKLEEIAKKYVDLAHLCIAYVNNMPSGLVAFYPNKSPKDSYLSIIMTKKEFRGLQIGKNLELSCIEYCKNYKSRGLLVNMRKSNTNLFNSRLKLGYKVIKEYQLDYSNEIIVDLYLEF